MLVLVHHHGGEWFIFMMSFAQRFESESESDGFTVAFNPLYLPISNVGSFSLKGGESTGGNLGL